MSFLTKIVRNISQRFRYHAQVTCTSNPIQNLTRNFSFKTILCAKMFMEHENKYAYNIMRRKGFAVDIETDVQCASRFDKDQFIENLRKDWSSKSPGEIFEVFPKFAAYCKENNICISDKMFDIYIDSLTDSLSKASDEELASVFYALNLWPETASIRTRNYIEVWVALDETCLSRLNQWSIDEMLTFIALFFMLNVSKASDFARKSLIKIAFKAKRLTPEQLVQTLFFIGIQRTSPYDMHNLEIQLENLFSEFSADDLAIMSMGFFKSRTPLRSVDLVTKIMEMIIANSKTIHEVSLAALLKVIRYSIKVPFENNIDMVHKLLYVLEHEIPRLSVMCNVHIALLGTSKLILHKGCLNSVADVVINNMSEARLKDLERLVLSYGTFRYTPQTKENFFNKIIDELRKPERQNEINKHGRSFACCLQYLGLLDLYPVDLIDKVLSEKFLHNTYGKQCFLYGREILALNNAAAIFCREQKITHLTDRESRIMSKKYTDYLPSEDFKKRYNITEKMILDIMKVLRQVRGGKDFVVGDHILPHHQRGDIILCNTPDGTPVRVNDKIDPKTFGLIRSPPDKNVWFVLVIAGRNGLIHDIQTPTGQFHVKIQELKALGYHANLVLWNVYSNLDTFEKKEAYLLKCINEAIKN